MLVSFGIKWELRKTFHRRMAAHMMQRATEDLERAETVEHLRLAESQAASAYWAA